MYNKHCKQPCCYKHEVLLKMRTTLCSHDEHIVLELKNEIRKCITPRPSPIKQGMNQQKLQLLKGSLGIFKHDYHDPSTLTTSNTQTQDSR